ncbi:MAG: hypothetical protein WDO74_25930 [Pseudomonadota bacterium]
MIRRSARGSGLLALCLWSAARAALAVPGPGIEPRPARDSENELVEKLPPGNQDDWTRHVRLGGGIALYYYQPTNGWQNQFLIYTNLRFDARWQPFGLHLEPRLSNEKMRPYYDGLAWIQEAYLFVEASPVVFKVGKIYKQLGLFWDGTFYGNIQVYEGLKLDPNAGVSLEGKLGEQAGLAFWAQFFVVDGHTNASLLGRDTISIPGARRRNTLLARVQPFLQLSKSARLEVGLSGEHFQAICLPAPIRVARRGRRQAHLGGARFFGVKRCTSQAPTSTRFRIPAMPRLSHPCRRAPRRTTRTCWQARNTPSAASRFATT